MRSCFSGRSSLMVSAFSTPLSKEKDWLEAWQTPQGCLQLTIDPIHCPFPQMPVLHRTFTLMTPIPCAVYAVGTPRWQKLSVQEKQIQWHKCPTYGFVGHSCHRHWLNSCKGSSVKSGMKPHCQVMNDWSSVVKFPVCCSPMTCYCGKQIATRTIIHWCRVPQQMTLCSCALMTITLVSHVALSNTGNVWFILPLTGAFMPHRCVLLLKSEVVQANDLAPIAQVIMELMQKYAKDEGWSRYLRVWMLHHLNHYYLSPWAALNDACLGTIKACSSPWTWMSAL